MIVGSIWDPDLEKLFNNSFGKKINSCDVLSSHGSDRIILRLKSDTGDSVIGVINKHINENLAFLGFTRHFLEYKLNVPAIYGVSDDNECYLIEDLGDKTLFHYVEEANNPWINNEITNLYYRVVNELPRFQIQAGKNADFSLCYQYGEFGQHNIEHDLKYFRDMFMNKFFPEYDKSKFEYDFHDLKSTILSQPAEFFLYRDFQSRNIMIKNEDLYFIDYQSGRKGALHYDIASLLYDAKADIPQSFREELLDEYVKSINNHISVNADEFKSAFWYFAIVRILQALGAYGFLGIVKKKPKFLESIPYALKNLSFILNEKIEHKHLIYLREISRKLKYDSTLHTRS